MKRNVILSFASTYSYYELQPFVESWRENAGNIELYLFYLDISEYTKKCLESMGVCLIEAPTKYKNEFLNNLGNVMYIRMRLFNEFLKKHDHLYDSVLISDTRDVIIQKDPFLNVPKEGWLMFSSEGVSIMEGRANPVWLTKLLGNEEWKKHFGNKEVINGGVYCGSLNEIIRYHELMIDKTPDDLFWGADQASINFVVHSGLLNTDNVLYSEPDTGEIVSVCFNRNGYKIKNDYIVNEYGEVPHVVHQYDRVSLLTNFVNSRYRKMMFEESLPTVGHRSALEVIRIYVLMRGYIKAINLAFSLTKRKMESCHHSLVILLIKDILHQCDLAKSDKAVPFVWQLIWEYAVDMFSNMTLEEKMTYIDEYWRWIKHSRFIHKADVDEFVDCVLSLLQYQVREGEWQDAHKLIRGLNWNIKSLRSDFYLLASTVCRHLKLVDESIALYSMGCNMQCYPIYYLGTHFQSCVFIKDNYLYQCDFIIENMEGAYPLCYMEKDEGCVLFIFSEGRFLYVQSIKENGSITLLNRPKIFTKQDVSDGLIAIKVDENNFLSARNNGEFSFAKLSRAWEYFDRIPCNETKLYFLMGR